METNTASNQPSFFRIHWTGGTKISGMFPAACGTAHGRLITNVTDSKANVNCGRCKRLAGFVG